MVDPFERLRPDYSWLIWGFPDTVQGGLPKDVNAKLDAERPALEKLQVIQRTFPLEWKEDASRDARFVGHPRKLTQARRRIAVFWHTGQRYFVDLIEGCRPFGRRGVSDARAQARREEVGDARPGHRDRAGWVGQERAAEAAEVTLPAT